MMAITTKSSITVYALPGRRRSGPFMCTIGRTLVENHRPRRAPYSSAPAGCPPGRRGGGGHVPDLHGPVRAGRGDPGAVGAERHARHPNGVAAERADLSAGFVPDLDRCVGPPPGHAPAVGAD